MLLTVRLILWVGLKPFGLSLSTLTFKPHSVSRPVASSLHLARPLWQALSELDSAHKHKVTTRLELLTPLSVTGFNTTFKQGFMHNTSTVCWIHNWILIGTAKNREDATAVMRSSRAEAKFFKIAFKCFKNIEVVIPITTMLIITRVTEKALHNSKVDFHTWRLQQRS